MYVLQKKIDKSPSVGMRTVVKVTAIIEIHFFVTSSIILIIKKAQLSLQWHVGLINIDVGTVQLMGKLETPVNSSEIISSMEDLTTN